MIFYQYIHIFKNPIKKKKKKKIKLKIKKINKKYKNYKYK